MKPIKFITKDLLLVGCFVKSDGSNSWEKWEDMDIKHEHHYLVNGEQAFEVWFYTKDGDYVFTGLEATEQKSDSAWEYMHIPETTYAIFEVNCNEDHDLQIKSIDEWLDKNEEKYKQVVFDAGNRIAPSDFDLCFFDHEGRFGKDRIMEIRVPLKKL